MIVDFTVENWKSFREPATLTMTASRERKHSGRTVKLAPMYGTQKILPFTAIFGANASGKTNLAKALATLRTLVVDGVGIDHAIPVEPFLFDAKARTAPVRFTIRFLKEALIYRYTLAATFTEIVEESLHIERTRTNELMFARTGSDISFGPAFDSEHHRLIARSTRPNDPFLHSCIEQNASSFRLPFEWFANTLQVLGPGDLGSTNFGNLIREEFQQTLVATLKRYDSSVAHVDLGDIPAASLGIDTSPIEAELRRRLATGLPGTPAIQLRLPLPDGTSTMYVFFLAKDNTLVAGQIRIFHANSEGGLTPLSLEQESRGIRRLVDLAPDLHELSTPLAAGGTAEQVLVLDEFDHAFHPELSEDLIGRFLASCTRQTRRQLIVTSHNLLLMDCDALRRDELWVASRGGTGADGGESTAAAGTTLTCIGRHEATRTDSSILKQYRKGVYGRVAPSAQP